MTEQQITPTPAEIVGARINALLWQGRVSQRAAAQALGVSQAGVSRRLRGLTDISVGELFVFADLLGIEPAELLTENGPATLTINVAGLGTLPRLDSNQQPSGYQSAQVRGASAPPAQRPTALVVELPAGVVDLADYRARKAS